MMRNIKSIIAVILLTASLSGCTAPNQTAHEAVKSISGTSTSDTSIYTVSAKLTANRSIFDNSDTTYATFTAEDGTVYTIDTNRYSIDTTSGEGDYLITYAITPSACGCCDDTVSIISINAA